MPNNIDIVRDQFGGRANKNALITFSKPIKGCTMGMDYLVGIIQRTKGDRENNRKAKF
jgi:hypothetical protein